MKTAISIPDNIFQQAEELANNLGVSRSQLYTKAIAIFIKNHSTDIVTEKLNEIYAQENSNLEPLIAEMQFNSLKETEW